MSEWDNTPWAGTPVTSNGLPNLKRAGNLKAVTDMTPWTGGPPLSDWASSPQIKAARYLQVYKCGWFNKAGRKISGDIARLGWTLSDGDAESDDSTETTLGKPDLDIPFDALSPIDQLQRLLEVPSVNPTTGKPNQTGRQLMSKLVIRRDFAGTGMWFLDGLDASELPSAIYGVSPARMTPARDKSGTLIGWVMDLGQATQTVFEANEIVNFPTTSAEDGDADLFGVSVVEAVYAQVPITDLLAKHTTDLMTTGGRLAGMLWPKDRSLNEDEFNDAKNAWRSVASDPNAARRLLLFPEPMEWSAGASTPTEIGMPELAALNQQEILTAFPISPHMLGVPHAAGLNASGEVRREERRDYWEGTIQPRIEEIIEVIQTQIVSRYEEAMGQTFDFDIPIPNLDDAPTLIEKVAALKGLWSVGFDEKETVAAVGLDHIKWNGVPEPVAPPPTPVGPDGQPASVESVTVATGQRGSRPTETTPIAKDGSGRISFNRDILTGDHRDHDHPPTKFLTRAQKSRKETRDAVTEPATAQGKVDLTRFFEDQKARIVTKIEGAPKSHRKAMPEEAWWNQAEEDRALKSALHGLYLLVGRGSLQVVADQLDKIVISMSVKKILNSLLEKGGDRITDINERTRDAIKAELTEGARRGYSIPQMVAGVPDENYAGVQAALMDNGVPVFDDYRAEMIARTESMLSFNSAALDSYREFNVEEVQAIDGDGDELCEPRDGQVFSIDDAEAEEEHPNGTLDWVPIVATASVEKPDPVAQLVTALKTAFVPASPVINNYIEPARAPDVHIDGSVVNVAPSEAPAVNVEPSVVNVTTPDVTVNVPETVVNVAAAEAPVVTVNVPEQVAPVVNVAPPNVTVKAPNVTVTPDVSLGDVTVNVSPEMRITGMPDRVTARKVTRDKAGRITETVDVETDA